MSDTVAAVLAARRVDSGEVQALVHDDRSVTFAELDDASRAMAARLVAAGVDRGDRVGLLAPNGIEWAVEALAVMRLGAVLVPLSTLLRPPELAAQLATAGVTHLIAVPRYRNRAYLDDLEQAAPGLLDRLAADEGHPDLPSLRRMWPADALPEVVAPAADVEQRERAVVATDDLAILFTSGSRGAPKGVIHTHANALAATAANLGPRCVRAGDRLYIPMPFFWMGGFGGGLFTVLVAGATLLIESDPEPADTIAFLERERVTLFRGWPDQAARLAEHPAFAAADLSSLGDASLPAVLPADRRPAPGARANLFGMTESFGPWCGDRLDTDMPEAEHGSCGRPFPEVEVRITDPDSGAPVPPGTDGQIELRGPTLMRGIVGRDPAEVFGPDGFYPTGDLGHLDGAGYLWYSGRLDDMVKVRGATVYPTEVEAALRATPGVRGAFVTDVPGDGGRRMAALVLTDRSVDDLVAGVRARLSAFKLPTVWQTTTDAGAVPRSATGKVDKAALQRLLARDGAEL